MEKHTTGPWKVGRLENTVVANEPTGAEGTGHRDVEYYGGNLICESVWKKADACLIAAAPELLALVEEYRDEIAEIAHEVRMIEEADVWKAKLDIVEAALYKAKGE